MSFHDAYLRRTPVDLLFENETTAQAWVESLADQPAGSDATDLAAFLGLGPVRELLDTVQPADTDGSAESPLGTLAFFAYHALRTQDIRLVEEHAVRRAISDTDLTEQADPSASNYWKTGAGYVQLPRNLVWSTPDPESRPQPVDGFFWYLPDGPSLSLLLVSGLLEGHTELSVMLVQDVPVSDARTWLTESMREDGPDFRSTLPGGEQLFSLVNLGEALKLASRLIALPVGEAVSQAGSHDPRPSWLEYGIVQEKEPSGA